MKLQYTPEINQFLIENRPSHTVKELVQMVNERFNLGCTLYALQSHLNRTLKIYGEPKRYTEEFKEVVRQTTRGRRIPEQIKEIKELTGIDISVFCLKKLRQELGVTSGINTQFKKGSIPFNKGKKLSEATREKLKRTWFTRNQVPHNRANIGDRVLRKGYWWEKTEQPNKWELVHVMVWEKYHGKKPPHSAIMFLDGNTENFDIDNLELVYRSELAMCNNRYKLEKGHPDYNKLVIAAVKLRRASLKAQETIQE